MNIDYWMHEHWLLNACALITKCMNIDHWMHIYTTIYEWMYFVRCIHVLRLLVIYTPSTEYIYFDYWNRYFDCWINVAWLLIICTSITECGCTSITEIVNFDNYWKHVLRLVNTCISITEYMYVEYWIHVFRLLKTWTSIITEYLYFD